MGASLPLLPPVPDHQLEGKTAGRIPGAQARQATAGRTGEAEAPVAPKGAVPIAGEGEGKPALFRDLRDRVIENWSHLRRL